MKNLFFLMATLFIFSGYAQSSDLNAYQYVIVPRKYEFQKSENQYRINTLTKFLLEKEGFKAFFEGEQPAMIANSPCQALKAEIVDESGVFTTKVLLQFKDCYGNVVFASAEGKSKIKDFEPSFHEAIREAFEDVQALNYTYDTDKNKALAVTAAPAPVKAADQSTVVREVKEEVEEPVAAASVQPDGSGEELPILYAQPAENGYQLVDTTPAVVFKIRKTSRPNTYTIIGKDGVLYQQEDGSWVAEYYHEGNLVKEVYQVKF